MSDTKLRIEKATILLKKDHDELKRLFEDYDEAGDIGESERMEIFGEIRRLLRVHTELEDAIFYPAIEALGEEGGAARAIREARDEHRQVSAILDEMSELPPSDDAFSSKMTILRDHVETYVEEEERTIFPLFRKLEREEQDRLSEELRSRRMEDPDRGES
jgi:iron-sulfur cluster repair protein YtfE (RIC family)